MISSVNCSQASAIETKAVIWVKYLDELSANLMRCELNAFYPLKVASIWGSTFAYIEWLVSFHETKTFPKKEPIAKVIKEVWGWDEDLAKLFWTSGRHPFVHVGQANSFYSYGKYNGLDTNVSFDVNAWSSAVTSDWDKYHKYKAVAVLPPLEMEGQKLQIVCFHHQMMRSELLPSLSKFVTDGIRAETSEQKLNDIVKLNQQILH